MDLGLISIKGATFPFQKSLPSMLVIQFYLVAKSSISTIHTTLNNLFFKTSPANFNEIWIPTQKCRKDRDSTKLTEVHWSVISQSDHGNMQNMMRTIEPRIQVYKDRVQEGLTGKYNQRQWALLKYQKHLQIKWKKMQISNNNLWYDCMHVCGL